MQGGSNGGLLMGAILTQVRLLTITLKHTPSLMRRSCLELSSSHTRADTAFCCAAPKHVWSGDLPGGRV